MSGNGKLVWLDTELVKLIRDKALPFETQNTVIRKAFGLPPKKKGRPSFKKKTA